MIDELYERAMNPTTPDEDHGLTMQIARIVAERYLRTSIT